MGLGIRLRTLWHMRLWVLACLLLALLAAVWSVAKISLGGLQPRSLAMASATTQIIVDTPQSTLVDARTDTYNIDALTNRAVLVGNVMATPEVRRTIAQRAHVPLELLQVVPPLTPKQPRVLAEDGNERHTTDIVKLNDDYRIFISANPTVPVLRIYALARDAKSAAAIANAAVDAASEQLTRLASYSRTPGTDQIKLLQLGRAEGTVIDSGIDLRLAGLVFLIVLALGCASVLFLRRVRDGWRLAALADQTAASVGD